MRAVIPEVSEEVLAWRKHTGADRWDEMWEGVLHMPPAPNPEHQDFEWQLETWLRHHFARPSRSRVYHNVNVAAPDGWPHNYRIPDLILLTRERFGIRRREYFEGGPDVVVEIRSPGDETREKMSFYAHIGVPEVWIIDRDTRTPEIHRLTAGEDQQEPAATDGWMRSPGTGIWLRAEQDEKLAIQMGDDAATRSVLPEDEP